MKKYVAPEITVTDLRAEERVCTCEYRNIGACTEPIYVWENLNS